jgi:hypothetical protein
MDGWMKVEIMYCFQQPSDEKETGEVKINVIDTQKMNRPMHKQIRVDTDKYPTTKI